MPLKARQKVLDDRRIFLSYPTARDISIRQKTERLTGCPMGKGMLLILDTIGPCRVAKICSNQDCMKVKWRPELAENREDEVETMMLCSRCRMTNYCSVSLLWMECILSLFSNHTQILSQCVSVQIGSVIKRSADLTKKFLRTTTCGRYSAPKREQVTSISYLMKTCRVRRRS